MGLGIREMIADHMMVVVAVVTMVPIAKTIMVMMMVKIKII